jgi:hypothetical protein
MILGSPWMSASGLFGSRVEASRDGISTMGLRGFWAMSGAGIPRARGRVRGPLASDHALRRYAARETASFGPAMHSPLGSDQSHFV